MTRDTDEDLLAQRRKARAELIRARRAVEQAKNGGGNVAPLHVTGEEPAAPQAKEAPAASPAPDVAARFRVMPRHRGLALSFALVVGLPVLSTATYLYGVAADQYHSSLAFTLRSEDMSSSIDLLGGLGAAIGSGASSASQDSDVLYEFIRSRAMVEAVDARLDLRELYRRSGADPLLRVDDDATIEELTDYWQRMVDVNYDTNSGLMEVRALAFTPEDAQNVAQVIYDESSRVINDLAATAREDATRYAREDLDYTLEQLKEAREALTAFRVKNQIVDISADLQGQTGLVANLEAQLATALIDYDMLAGSTQPDDPRIEQSQRRIDVIRDRIRQERNKFSEGGPSGTSYSQVVAEFERLTVDREFAETAYTSARSNYDAAVAEANRRSRYLAAYVTPQQAQKSEYPRRGLNIMLVAFFSFLIWSIGALVYYSLRDRR